MRRALGATLGALALLWTGVASAQAAGSIIVQWSFVQDNVNPASGFVLQRCVQLPTGCTMTDLSGASNVPLATMNYTDITITQGVTYCYQLAAINSFGRGKYSTQTCGVLGGPPGTVPQNVILKLQPGVI